MSAIERAIHELNYAGFGREAAAARAELTALRDDLEGLRNKVGQLRAESESIRRGKYGLADLSEQILALTTERDQLRAMLAGMCRVAIKCNTEGFIPAKTYQWYLDYERDNPTTN